MALYTFDDPYTLPESARKIIPQELGDEFLGTLDKDFQLQEKKQLEDLLGFQESRGLLSSGDTQKKIAEQVLGPGIERRKQALLGLAVPAAMRGEEESFERESRGTAFERQRQFAGEEFSRRLTEIHEQASIQAELLRLQAQLEQEAQPGFGTLFARSFGMGFGGGLGSGLGARLTGR